MIKRECISNMLANIYIERLVEFFFNKNSQEYTYIISYDKYKIFIKYQLG